MMSGVSVNHVNPVVVATLSDLVAYGEMTFSGRVPDQGVAGEQLTRPVAELRAIGWIPER
jgi:chromosome partitioning protein